MPLTSAAPEALVGDCQIEVSLEHIWDLYLQKKKKLKEIVYEFFPHNAGT